MSTRHFESIEDFNEGHYSKATNTKKMNTLAVGTQVTFDFEPEPMCLEREVGRILGFRRIGNELYYVVGLFHDPNHNHGEHKALIVQSKMIHESDDFYDSTLASEVSFS